MFEKQFDKIFWVIGAPNASPPPQGLQVPVECIVGIPETFENVSGNPQLFVIDDSMLESQNKTMASLFTKGCHHQNISVIFITQNIFHQSKYARDISLNFSHLVIMNNPRDRLQFQHLARQLYPENSRTLSNIYRDITQEPFSYIYIDLNQNTHPLLRFRSDIFNKNYTTVYCSDLPIQINGEDVQNEIFGEGSAHAFSFTESQL